MDAKLIPSTVVEALGKSGAMEFDDLLKQVQKYQKNINENEFGKSSHGYGDTGPRQGHQDG